MFDFSDAEDFRPFEVLPKGIYNVVISNAEDKLSQGGSSMFKIEFTITDGEHKGKKIWKNFIYKVAEGKNPNTVRIAKSQIKQMCLAAGKEPAFQDITGLIGLEMGVSTKVRKQEGYPDSAEISHFLQKLKTTKNEQPF